MSDIGKRVSIDVSVNIAEATKSLDIFNKKLGNMSKKITVNINTDKAVRDLNKFSANLTGVYGKLEKSSKVELKVNTSNASKNVSKLTADLLKLGNTFKKMSSQMSANSFVNSFKGIKNSVKQIEQAFKNLKGVKIANNFMNGFIKTVIAKSKLAQKAIKDMNLVKTASAQGMAAGAGAAAAIALGIAKEAWRIKRNIDAAISDAINNDYSVNLKAKGMEGSLINSQIDAKGMGKELTAVAKKYANTYLEFKESSRNTAKVVSQAASYLRKGGDKNNVTVGIANKRLREVVITGDKYLKKWKDIYNTVKNTEKPLKTLANMGFNKASGNLTASILQSVGAFKKAETTGKKALNALAIAAKGSGLVILKALQGAFNFIPVIGKFVKIGMNIGKAIASGVKKVVGIFRGIMGFIAKAILGPINLVINVGKAIGRAIFKGITAIFNVIKIGVNIIKSIVSGITKALSLVINAGKMIANALIKGVKAVAGLIKLGATIAKNIITGITRTVKSFVNIGLTIGRAIVRGVTSAVKFVGAFAKTFVNLGINISKAIGRGIKAGLGFVTNAIKTLTKGIMAPIKLLGKTITSTIGKSFSISRSVMGGIGNTIMEALDGDHTIELELVPSSGNILSSLIDKRDVTNQLKRDLSVITATMPKELGQVTNAFGAKILDAGQKVQRYANLMLQAYDFVRSNKGVIVSTFQKLYGTMAPVAKRIMSDLGIVLRDYGQKAMLGLKSKMTEKISPIIEPFKNVLDVVKGEFIKVKDNLSGFSGQLADAVSNVRIRIGDIVDSLRLISVDIQSRFASIVDSFIGVVDSAKVSFKNIIGDFGGVTAIVKAKMEDSSSMFGQLAGIAKRKLDDALDVVKGRLGNVIDVIKERLPFIMESITNLVGVVIANLRVAMDKVIEVFNRFKPVLEDAITGIKNFVGSISAEDIKNKFNDLKEILPVLIAKIRKFISVLADVMAYTAGALLALFSPVIAAVGAIYLLTKSVIFLIDCFRELGNFIGDKFKAAFNKINTWLAKKTDTYDYEKDKAEKASESRYDILGNKSRYKTKVLTNDIDLKSSTNEFDYMTRQSLANRHNKMADEMASLNSQKRAKEHVVNSKVGNAKEKKQAAADIKKIEQQIKQLEVDMTEVDVKLVEYLKDSSKHKLGRLKDGVSAATKNNDEKELNDIKKSLNEYEKNKDKNKLFDFESIKKSLEDMKKEFSQTNEEIQNAASGTEKFSSSTNSAAQNMGEVRENAQGMGSIIDDFSKHVKSSFSDFTESVSKAFDTEPVQNIKEAVTDIKEEASGLGDTIVSAFDGTSVENIKNSITEAFDKNTTDRIKNSITGAFDNEFTDAIKQRVASAAEEAKRVATKQASPERLAQAKSNLKSTGGAIKQRVVLEAETRLFQQKLDGAFQSVRHPINALKQEISAKLGKVHINLTVKGEQQAKKAVNDVYNAMQKFKSAKGSEKLTAGIDVAIQSIKYKLITLKNTMKENFVSNLINKMSGKAKKASKELAENVPGGAKTIGFFKSSLGKLSLLLGGFGIGSYIKQATDLAIKYEASAMQIQNSLGKASQKITDFAQNSAAALGISQTDAMTYGNKFSLMVRQFEKDTDKIANTTNALMQAAAITASATGTELSTVMDSFQSALTGSSEAVDQYGLNMKIANLEARLGIDNWNDLTVAQQQFYITQELINQTTANFGNKTLKNTNSMLAQFKAQMSNTSLALGKAFKALLTVVLPYLTAFMKVLEKVFNYISTMITSLLSLFGITVDFTSNAASGIEAVGGDIDTSGLDGVSEGMDNAADSADKAAESAEKMKGSLAG